MPKINPEIETFARIKVIGVGGSGKNALNHMINSKVKGVEFIVMNTDTQDLLNSLAEKKVHLGKNLTKGLGAGMDPDVGRRAAEETKAEIQDVIKGSAMVFIACGMGGGTGTGAAPIVAQAAKEQGILTVAVVTKPFSFEGNHRMRLADAGIAELEGQVDAILVIPNDRILVTAGKDLGFREAFAMCDEVLKQAVESISELITTPGKINLDFNDIRAVMHDAGSALMGVGIAAGEGRAEKAALQAINSPLLDLSIAGAKGALFAIAGGDDLTIHEINEVARIITESIDKEAKVFLGTIHDEKLKKGEIKVTVIATGFPTDLPKRSLFQINAQAQATKAIEQQTVAQTSKEDLLQALKKDTPKDTSTEYLKKADKGSQVEPDEELVIDDTDDWSTVPAFLRRNKK
jgi:cell division protein FtsZ